MWYPFRRKSEVTEQSEPAGEPLGFSMALLTDPGCQRATNQDAGRLMRPPQQSAAAEKGLLAVIADGMGGHQGGEVASALAIETVCRCYYAQDGPPGECLAAALEQANRAIFQEAAQNPNLAGMGTTCTALVLRGALAYVAHVGDSRLYLVRDQSIYQMTEDHSLVMEMVRTGVLTAEAARNHPERNVLQRALGRQLQVEVSGWHNPIPIQLGDRLILCSDGLPTVVSDETIRDVALAENPAAGCSALIRLARQQNAPDNVTVGILRVDAFESGKSAVPDTREAEIPGGFNQ
jgi:protein phosphatase